MSPSRTARRKNPLRPPAPSVSPPPSPHPQTPSKKQKRPATVYDAVAGRVSTTGFLPTHPFTSKHRDTLSSSTHAAPPEEVLFRRKNAPPRYEEHDLYFAHDSLDARKQRLPDSELLKAVHVYAAEFYARHTGDGGKGDWRSLDETALVAVGVLVEEGVRGVLGGSGDLVFVEGEGEGEGVGVGVGDGGEEREGRVGVRVGRSVVESSEAARRSGLTRRKRRKLMGDDDGEGVDG